MKRQWQNIIAYSLVAFGGGVLFGNVFHLDAIGAVSIFLGSIVLGALAIAAW